MRGRMLTAAAVAVALLAAAPAAQASGTGDDGPVHIGVIGEGLKVREVRAILDGHEAGARASVSLWKRGKWVREVRGWKYTTARDVKGYKFEYASWNLRNKKFPHKSRLCVEFDGHDDRLACVTIQR